MPSKLTTKQQAHLRSLAQQLRPQLHVSYEGVTPGVVQALEDLFRRRELVKGRVLKSAEQAAFELATAVAEQANASVVGVVGQTFVLYRPNPDLKNRIELPEAGTPARTPPIASRR